jgi:hypothetical protein
VTGLIALVLVLFPPFFGVDIESEGRVHASLGYHPVWSPPTSEHVYEVLTSRGAAGVDEQRISSFQARLNVVHLVFNIFVLVIITLAAVFVFRRSSVGT